MDLVTNPFHTLGATMDDSRRRIAELAEEKSLLGDETSIREARGVLTNPRKRLAAEVAWLPGVRPERVAEAMSLLDGNPVEVRRFADVSTLAHANLLAEGLVRSGASLARREIAQWIVELSETHERLRAEEILDVLNDARSTAGFAPIPGQGSVEEALQGRRRYFRDAIKRCLDHLPAYALVDTVRMTVDQATQRGAVHAPILIDDLVHTYEVDRQESLNKKTENLKTLVQQIRDAASNSADDAKIDALVAKLERVAKSWDYVAQPIQISYSSRGLSHELSHDVAREIRELAVDLYNQYGLLEVSKRLTAIQQDVFAEIAKITEQADDDASTLAEFAKERADCVQRIETESWAREVTYEAHVGIMKNKLRISPEGVHWKGVTIGLEEITRVRWSGTKHSLSGIPTGTTYDISVGGKETFVQVTLKNEEIFTEFVERLWKAAGVRLLTAMLEELRAGRGYQFGTAVVGDYGMILERSRIFRANERVRCGWSDLSIWNGPGTFCIAKTDERKVAVELPYDEVDNVHILEAAMRAFWKKAGPRLSDLLESTE